MNLKESFRYQNFLDGIFRTACSSIKVRNNALVTTRTHLKSAANPDAADVVETATSTGEFFPNDDVIRFMQRLIVEREKLTKAISTAKVAAAIDIDAAIETNKFRQMANDAVRTMLAYQPSKTIERGTDHRFNVEGNQMPYYYDIEVQTAVAYDREAARTFMRSAIADADKVSAAIDAAMINTIVDYEPTFDVNDSFEDAMCEFLAG